MTNIAVTGFDEDADLVFGTAAPGSEVIVAAFDAVDNGWADWYTANASGDWTADFSGYEDITDRYLGLGGSARCGWRLHHPGLESPVSGAPANDLLARC